MFKKILYLLRGDSGTLYCRRALDIVDKNRFNISCALIRVEIPEFSVIKPERLKSGDLFSVKECCRVMSDPVITGFR